MKLWAVNFLLFRNFLENLRNSENVIRISRENLRNAKEILGNSKKVNGIPMLFSLYF